MPLSTNNLSHNTVVLLIAGGVFLTSQDVMAKTMVKKTTTTGINKRTINKKSKKSQYILCEGNETLITTDTYGMTQVYVNDGSASSHPEVTQQEDYRVEGVDDWTQVDIFGGAADTNVQSVNIRMDGGTVGSIFLSGLSEFCVVEGDARLEVSGGTVDFISVTGNNYSPVKGEVTISLSDMTYRGMYPSLYKEYDEQNGEFITEDVTFNVDNVTFVIPESNPYYVPESTDECQHELQISNLTPDACYVDAGTFDLACTKCGQEWLGLDFSACGYYDLHAMSYNTTVWQQSTIIEPTCQPGKGEYGLYVEAMMPDGEGTASYLYENNIPPIGDVHQYDADGKCKASTHYKIQRTPNGTAAKDRFGNLLYVLDSENKPVSDRTPSAESRSYTRMARRFQYLTVVGDPVMNLYGSYIEYVDYEDAFFESTPENVEAQLFDMSFAGGHTQKILGLNSDVAINTGWNTLTFTDSPSGVILDLNEHTLTLKTTNSSVSQYVSVSSSHAIKVRNGTLKADFSSEILGGDVILEKATIVGTSFTARSVRMDQESTISVPGITLSLVGDADNNGSITSADAMMIANMIIGKVAMPSDIAPIDVDLDGQLTIADVIMIISISLDKAPKVYLPTIPAAM